MAPTKLAWTKITIAAAITLASLTAHAEIMADIWVTKYALTRGIQHEKAKLEAGGEVALVGQEWYRKGDFELTEVQAVSKAEVMRRKQIASLERRLDKLNNLSFTVDNIK